MTVSSLISIMLSRFRMTTSDCLGEYETMAGQIFMNPRWNYSGTGMSLLTKIMKRKYPTRDMRQAIRNVISRRQERPALHPSADERPPPTDPDDVLFETQPGTCRGYVPLAVAAWRLGGSGKLTLISRLVVAAHKKPKACTAFLIRSYEHEVPNHEDVISGGSLPIRFAARAATAAPTFFRNLTLDISGPAEGVSYRLADRRRGRVPPGCERQVFTDAGWVLANNPAFLVMQELNAGGKRPRIVLVSVGTAASPDPTGEHFPGYLKAFAQQATDSREADRRMRVLAERDGHTSYFRFDLPDGLPVGTDEWQPRGRGHTTQQTIQAAFETWRTQEEAQSGKEECARQLVQLRRQRCSADRAKWNRYAAS